MTSRARKPSGKRARKQPEPPSRPVLTKDGVPLARIRRAPNPLAFLVTGAVIGAILGLVLAGLGEDGSYSGNSASAYFVVFFGALGALAGGLVFAILDRRS